MANVTTVVQDRYGYSPTFGVSGQWAEKGVSLIQCKDSDSALKNPFYFLAGVVTLVASAILAAIEAPAKLIYNTGAFLANKISDLIYGPNEVEVQVQVEAKGLAALKEKALHAVKKLNEHKPAIATGIATTAGAFYLGLPAAIAAGLSYIPLVGPTTTYLAGLATAVPTAAATVTSVAAGLTAGTAADAIANKDAKKA